MGKHYDYDWEKLIEQQKQSGMNMKAFCKEHQLPYQTFKSHKNTLLNGKAEIDDNRGERFIKPFGIGRRKLAVQ